MKLFRTIEAVADGHYCVGDVIAFALNDGEEVEALAVKQEQDGMIFVLVDCLRKEYAMNRTDSNRLISGIVFVCGFKDNCCLLSEPRICRCESCKY